jgi:small subunit ribosomal protein S4e
MSRKGENKKTKTISMSKVVNTSRKETAWTVNTRAGPHTKETSVALGIVIRNYAGIVATMKEAKKILNNSEVKVNGIIRKEHQFPIGLFDVVTMAKQKLFFRMVFDTKGRLVLKAIDAEAKDKLSKVTGKVMTAKGIQITTDDARTFLGVKANVGDSLKVALPKGNVVEVIAFSEGAQAYITKGAHCAQVAKIVEIVQGTEKKEKLVKLASGKDVFETIAKNIHIVGKDKVEVEALN